MAKFCTECGTELMEGKAFCTGCGMKLADTEQPPVPEEIPAPEAPQPPAPAVQPPQPVQPKPVSPPPPAVPVAAPAQPPKPAAAPAQVKPAAVDTGSKTVSTGTYFGLMFLFALPLIGLLSCIIAAFAPKNKSIRNFARAILLWTLIGVILAGILLAAFAMLAGEILELLEEATGVDIGDWGSLLEEVGSTAGTTAPAPANNSAGF